MAQSVTDADFNAEVLQSSKPVVVDFWAEWCGPCKMIAPMLDEVSSEMADQIEVRKLNVDENSNIPMQYGIRSLPTLMLFKDGEVVGTKVGALTKGDLKSWVASAG